ncbi:MAG: glycoside hydrolase family 3 C-terminal domain-containing protein [Bacteroidaceae bacterium]|nr:glycoside hydrolase family 3 C-terminal domain-containing protein [Bacteroidaceae bacterium]
MKIKYLSIVMLLLLTFTAKAQNKPVYLDPNASVEARVQDALSRMTTHEKVRILHAQSKFSSAGVPRLGIRELHHSDGPHGVRAEVDWNSWGSANWNNDSIVAFPSLTCLAATWNREMSAIYGTAIGEEFAFRDKNLLLGPGTTIARMPLNGRSFEYMGEDPYLAGELAVPYIKNVQKSGVGCCLKHFFLNNQEVDRFTINVNVSERAIHEIYLPAFKKCVQEAHVWTIMGSYNLWNNVHCCQNDELLNKILKQQWGFDGAVVSDWGGVTDTWQAALGGMDIEMGSYTNGKTVDHNLGWNKYFLADPFEELINEGKIPMDVLNDKAARVLRTIFRTSMNPNKAIGSQCSEAHYDACQQVGEEGIVLLKNQKDFLPLDASKYSKVLVVGENATRSLTEGGGSSELKTKFDISPLDGLKAVFGDGVDYAKGYVSGRAMYDFIDKISPDTLALLRAEAIEKAKNADLVIYVGGLNKNTYEDCEANDRLSYDLSFGQNELIAGLAKANKNVVVVTFGGNPYATPWLANVQALVHCWYLGSMAGTSIANVLTGKVNPSGKLPVTWAVNMNDYPCFKYGKEGYPGVDKQVYYKEGIYVGYRYFDTNKVRPQFPFGFGLSYTTFKYGKATVSSPQMTSDGSVTVSIPVTNVGKVDGKEIVQLYIGDDKCSVDRPVKELKNFCKLSLKPGETKTATFTIRPSDLEFYDEAKHQFVAEPGTFKAYLCASETDVRSSVAFELK